MKKVMLLAPERLCDILRNALEPKCITLPCSDGGAAKEILLSKPDVLILTLALPGESGLTFLKENGARLPPKVIVLTVFYDEEILSQLANWGVSSVIRIPCKFSYLESKL